MYAIRSYYGYVSVQKLEDYSKLVESFLSYKDEFGKIGVDAIAGYSYQYFFNEGLRNTASGFLSDEFKWYSLQAASTLESATSYAESRITSYNVCYTKLLRTGRWLRGG